MKMMPALICAILLTVSVASAPDVQGQTRRGRRSRASRVVRTKPVKPPATPSAYTTTTTPTGLIYVITRRTEGRQPHQGETVAVHYTGLLTSGVKFDSSLDRGEPIKFKLGMGRVIKGWDEAVARLRVGEQATIIIPPSLGYGERGAGGGVIPPGATLIFVVELVGVEEAAPASN